MEIAIGKGLVLYVDRGGGGAQNVWRSGIFGFCFGPRAGVATQVVGGQVVANCRSERERDFERQNGLVLSPGGTAKAFIYKESRDSERTKLG